MLLEKEKLQKLLGDAIMLLCRTSMQYSKEMCIEGLIGITLDKKDVCLISLKEIVDNPYSSSSDEKDKEKIKEKESSKNENFTQDLKTSVKVERDSDNFNNSSQSFSSTNSNPLNPNYDPGDLNNSSHSYSSPENSNINTNYDTNIIKKSSQCRSNNENDHSNTNYVQVKSEPNVQLSKPEISIKEEQPNLDDDDTMYIEDSDDDCQDIDYNNFVQSSLNYNNEFTNSYNDYSSLTNDSYSDIPSSSGDVNQQDFTQYLNQFNSKDDSSLKWMNFDAKNMLVQNSSQQDVYQKFVQCKICEKEITPVNLRRHMREVHMKERRKKVWSKGKTPVTTRHRNHIYSYDNEIVANQNLLPP